MTNDDKIVIKIGVPVFFQGLGSLTLTLIGKA